MKNINYKINNIFNIFSSNNLENILKEYNINNYYYLNQIHSNIIKEVDDNYINNSDGDALITRKINTPLVIRTADCISILIYDKENNILSLVHSGWKGTLNGITIDVINYMKNKYNTNISNLEVYIYPSIRKCHFEVDIDVYTLFKNKINNIDKYTNKINNKYYISLQSILKDSLNNLGINNIIDNNICTYCNNKDYHSYRYNHTNKRNYLIAYIKK